MHEPVKPPAEDPSRPHLSLVIPCYNEEEALPPTVQKLLRAFEKDDVRLELVCVDNGSSDRTGLVIADLITRFPGRIRTTRVARNIGMGQGVLSGIPLATAPLIGVIPADGQVDAEDCVRLYEAVIEVGGPVVGKVRRRFRMDGLLRKMVSVAYNMFVRALWPGIGSWDINGCPRILPREVWFSMELESTNWLLEPETLIKAHYLGLRVLELNVFARTRARGLSHVRASTCWEFFVYLLRFRFSGTLRRWRQRRSSIGPTVGPMVGSAQSTRT